MSPATFARILLIVTLFATGCSSRTPRVTLPDVADAGCPFVLLTRRGGLGFESQAGLIGAVWESGQIIRSESTTLYGGHHFAGTIAPADVDKLKEVVQSPRTWDHAPGEAAPDAPDDILTLRRGTEARQWVESPGFTSTPVVAEFRSMLFSVPVTRARAIDDALDEVMKCAGTK